MTHPFSLAVAAAIVISVAVRARRLGAVRIATSLVVAAGFAVYGSGVIHLPNAERVIRDVGSALGPWAYVVVGVFAFLETGAFVGLLVPGETVILAGGALTGQGKLSLPIMIGVTWACAAGGDTASFLIGRRLGREFLERHGPKVKITEPRLQRVEAFFDKHGGRAVLLGRFIGFVRAVMPFTVGTSSYPFRRYLVYDLIGSGAWGAALVGVGYAFSSNLNQAAKLAGQGGFAIGATIVVVVGGVVAYRYLREPDNRERVRDLWRRVGERR